MCKGCKGVQGERRARGGTDLYVSRPVTTRTIMALPCTALTSATVVNGVNPPASSPTLVSTKDSCASPAESSVLLTMMYAVTLQKKSVIMSTHSSSIVFSVRRQSTPGRPNKAVESVTLEAARVGLRGGCLGAQWPGLTLGVLSCPEPSCVP